MDTYFDYHTLHHNEDRTKTLELWSKEFLEFINVKYINPPHIISSTDFEADSLQIAVDKETASIREMIDKGQSHIGRMFFPLKERNDYYIIFKDELFNNNWKALSTFAHEFTHVIDYKNFIAHDTMMNGNKYTKNIKDHPLYPIMFHWGEFHANYVQRLFSMWLLMRLNPDKYSKQYFQDYILNQEIINSNIDVMANYRNNMVPISELYIYIGRYLAYEKVCPTEFSEFKMFPTKLFRDFEKHIRFLYNYLSGHSKFCNSFTNLEGVVEFELGIPALLDKSEI